MDDCRGSTRSKECLVGSSETLLPLDKAVLRNSGMFPLLRHQHGGQAGT